MFLIYGLQGPALLGNGPTTVEVQGRWIADCIAKMERNKIKSINAKPEAAKAWKDLIVEQTNRTLFPTVNSPYMRGRIPGKVKEPVCYAGGMGSYVTDIRRALDTMDGFEKVMA
jgi:hypothetical protein